MFYNAIKAQYPSMNIISSIWFGYFQTLPPPGTIQDLHDYFSVDDMVGHFGGYDNAPRDYPVLVGEYAAIHDAQNQGNAQLDNPTLQSATSEAVYFLGLERNSDVVIGVCHGALIKNLHDEPNNVAMIKQTANAIVPSMSYYVAKLFGSYYGTETVPLSGDTAYGPLYWAGTKNSSGTYFIKVVNYNGASSTPVTINIPGKTNTAKLITVGAPAASSVNTLGNMQTIWTETTVNHGASGYSFTLNGNYISAVLVV